jgi:hypothetical protein
MDKVAVMDKVMDKVAAVVMIARAIIGVVVENGHVVKGESKL